MNRKIYDSVIIGGGMSGLMAAITLTQKGRRVALISKGDPICCLSTGCIDILGKSDAPLEEIATLPDEHPYRLAGRENIERSLEQFLSIMKEAGLTYAGSPEKNRTIMTSVGAAKHTALVPGSMAEAQVAKDDYLHVISFKNIKDFFPGYVTARYPNSGVSEFDAGVPTTLGIAARFDDASFREEFVQWVKGLDIPAGKIAVPAVLGTKPGVFEEIAKEIGREIFEVPTLPPSIPGLRLFKGLRKYLQDNGGELFWGLEVASVEKEDGIIEAVTVTKGGRPTRIAGKTFILATGSFVSGGLYARQKDGVKESVFDLPAHIPENRETWFNPNFFEKGHEVEKAGIRVDESFQPKDADCANLFVCGSILAFSEIMKYQCGHGLAIATGFAAANKCEEKL